MHLRNLKTTSITYLFIIIIIVVCVSLQLHILFFHKKTRNAWVLLTFLIFYFMLALVFLWLWFNSFSLASIQKVSLTSLQQVALALLLQVLLASHATWSFPLLSFASLENYITWTSLKTNWEWKVWLSNNTLKTTTQGRLLHGL